MAIQSLNYADMEVQISSIVRNTFNQMNFSTPTKEHADLVKNVGAFHHNSPIDESFATWLAEY
ncbi:unnamed protein product [Hymenolepis diminuta]|uniref:Uncharacterized protein n=1 Tax=Hymenolepis diminuta TaxID=6216 RepID=A0A564ZBJ9_HYMDI|nr:unnamed protein product [Hymenolepis diminuta]